jgi:hypothetical protein
MIQLKDSTNRFGYQQKPTFQPNLSNGKKKKGLKGRRVIKNTGASNKRKKRSKPKDKKTKADTIP